MSLTVQAIQTTRPWVNPLQAATDELNTQVFYAGWNDLPSKFGSDAHAGAKESQD